MTRSVDLPVPGELLVRTWTGAWDEVRVVLGSRRFREKRGGRRGHEPAEEDVWCASERGDVVKYDDAEDLPETTAWVPERGRQPR